MIEKILERLNNWVSLHGNGCYWGDGEKQPSNNTYVHKWQNPIQQVKYEIYEFAKVLYNLEPRKTILEIGLGYYGGTRYLWQMLFEQVVTIEIDEGLVLKLDYSIGPKDLIIIGDSLQSFEKVQQFFDGKIDVLFIDGHHTYEQAMNETILYYPLVRSGGIIAWHDTCQKFGVELFVEDFKSGKIDGIKHNIITLDLAHTGSKYGIHPDSPEGVKIGLSYMTKS